MGRVGAMASRVAAILRRIWIALSAMGVRGRSGGSKRRGARRLPAPNELAGKLRQPVTLVTALAVLLGTAVTVVVAASILRDPAEAPHSTLAGDDAAVHLDPPKPMDRPKPTDGTHIDGPKGGKADADKSLPTKPGTSCDAADDGVKVGELPSFGSDSAVCTSTATGESDDHLKAPHFKTAPGYEPAPKVKPGKPADEDPATDGEDGTAGDGEDAEDGPSADPSDNPTGEPSPEDDGGSEATDGVDPQDSPTGDSASKQAPDAAAGSARGTSSAAHAASPAVIPAVATKAAPSKGEFLAPNWQQLSPINAATAVAGSSMVFDEARGLFVRFGGVDGKGKASDETWVWNGQTWAEVKPKSSPSPRSQAAMVWDPVGQRVLLFGGRNSAKNDSDVLDDLWAWDGSTWTEVDATASTDQPSARAGAAMAFDPIREAVVMFGGTDGSGPQNDTWQLAGDEWELVQETGAAGAPAPRVGFSMGYSISTSQLVIFGGSKGECPKDCSDLDDTWILPADSDEWVEQSPEHKPHARSAHAMTYHPGLKGLVVFGGVVSKDDRKGKTKGKSTLLNDTWAWTGDDWSQATGLASPEGRAGAAIATSGEGQMVVAGGVEDQGIAATTLALDSSVPLLSIDVTREASADGGETTGTTFWVGDTARITLTATNTGNNLISNITLTSALQDTLLAAGTEFRIDPGSGMAKIASCNASPNSLCGIVNSLTASITNLSIPAGQSTIGDFLASIVGTQRGCELIDVPAIANSLTGSSGEVYSQLTVCGGGLGLEDWWTYDTTDLGGGGTASVNVANGNLVVQQYDTNPVQTRGRLALGLGRVYNSQGHMGGTSPLGSGWSFDLGQTSEFAGGPGIGGLMLPNLQTLTQPLSMPYIDRDGTRHVFKLRSIDVTVGNLTLPISLTGQGLIGTILGLLNPNSLPFKVNPDENAGYTNLCIDEAYSGPPGSNMFLFRYVGLGAGCEVPGSGGLNLGWSLIRTDRLRYDFDILGRLLQVTDPTGQQLKYKYGVNLKLSEISTSSCGNTGAACPKLSFAYPQDGEDPEVNEPPGVHRVVVTDAAKRATTYVVTDDLALPLLKEVWEPGNPYSTAAKATPSASYTYATTNDCAGGSAPHTAGQLCSVTDALGKKTTFRYAPAPIGPDRVTKVTDRRGNEETDGLTKGLATVYSWSNPTDTSAPPIYVNADMGTPNQTAACASTCERVRYSQIDKWGRVGVIEEGNSANNYLRQAGYFWDGLPEGPDGVAGGMGGIASCSQTGTMNHNLCQTIRRAVPTTAAFTPGVATTGTVDGVTVHDEAIDYLYGELGQKLRQKVLLNASQAWTNANSSITTWGTHDQYFDAGGVQRAFNNHVVGEGQVDPTGRASRYPSAVMGDGPVGYWRLDDTTGSVVTAKVGPPGSYGGDVVKGLPGAILDGTSIQASPTGAGYMTMSGLASGTTATSSDFTVEVWQKTSDVTGYQHSIVWGSSNNSYVTAGLQPGGYPAINLAGDVAAAKASWARSTASVSDGQWHHIVYTYNGNGSASGIKIWVDGVQQTMQIGLNTLGGTAFSVNPAFVRMAIATDDVGQIDELAVYDKVLTPAQMQAHRNSGFVAVDRVEPETLYAVTDTVQELSPRGNAPADENPNDKWGDYLTTTRVDVPADGQLVSTNATNGPVCQDPANPNGNTGLVCEVDSPSSADVTAGACQSPTADLPAGSPAAPTSAGYTHACTKYEYNNAGQRTIMRTPNANADSAAAATTYSYYDDTTSCAGAGQDNCDLSGTVSAGGWLKAVTDPTGERTVFAYDAAGNPARTWERNATHGIALNASWTNASNSPSTKYTDQVNATPVTSDSLSVSATGTITLAPDGTTWGAGTNTAGELGDGTTTVHKSPVQANGLTNVVQVAQSSTGAAAACKSTVYLRGDGTVWQSGTINGKSTPEPVEGDVLKDVISIAAGGCHNLALDAQGHLYAWGTGTNGQLGNGATTSVSTPVKVMDNVSTMAAGALHSLAVKTDGSVWAWGSNTNGRLGDGTTTQRTSPVEITTLSTDAAASQGGIRALAAGVSNSFAIGRDGTVWAWGANTSGALGDGTTTQRTSPVKIATLGPNTAAGTVRQVVAGNAGGAALMTDGTVRAWGINTSGQLGNGTASGTATVPTLVSGLTGQVALAGGNATYASADAAGQVKVWGATNAHQLANGAVTPPARATTPTTAGINISPYRLPGWTVRGKRDAVGNLTTQTVDRLGQTRRIRSGRGNDILTSAYDQAVGYDAAGRQVWSVGAQHRDSNTVATTSYDAFGNPVKTIDATGIASLATFDTVNRQLTSQVTRGDASTVDPTICQGTATTAAWTAGQNGHKICTISTTYDGRGQSVSVTNADSQTTRTWLDAAGRTIRVDTPRSDGTYTVLRNRWNYDRDGNVLDACSPRQFDSTHESNTTTDSAAGCTSTGVHSMHSVYDRAGRLTSSKSYRAAYNGGTGSPVANVTSYGYDADGNQISVTDANGHETTSTYSYLGRRTSTTVPRSATKKLTTRWSYDYSGNTTAVFAPGSRNTGTGVNGPLVVDGTTAANSSDGVVHDATNPFQIPDGAQYTDVTLQNGAHITSAHANGLVFQATGTVTVCSTCVVTMNGKGQTGGAGGTGGAKGASAANPNPGNGGTGGAGGLGASGGGGGGHKTDGQPGLPPNLNPGLPGLASGAPDLTDVGSDYLAGSGGGGGGGGQGTLGGPAGKGGNGGGYIRITAETITIDGLVTATGTAGTNSGNNAAGGGGGAGGGIWLSATDLTLAPNATDVTGGAGGTGSGSGTAQKNGGAGAPGLIRLEFDAATIPNIPAGADTTRGDMITAVSYDAANRPIDTLEGAQTSQADAVINHSNNAAPDTAGFQNTRTRAFYDADNQLVAVLPPTAFTDAASLTTPDVSVARRNDYDLDGNPVATYVPRYSATVASLGAGDDGGTGVNQQTAQCPTIATSAKVMDQVKGLSTYGSSVGVCVSRTSYDPLGRIKRQYLPNSTVDAQGNRDNAYLEYTYTGDNLARTITGPNPADPTTGRVAVAINAYDGSGRQTKATNALGFFSATSYTGDGLVKETGQAYDPDDNTSTGGTNGPLPAVSEVTNMAYDAGGNQITSTNPKGHPTTQAWTSDNLLASITAPGPDPTNANTKSVTKYTYDGVGNQTAVLNPNASAAAGGKAVVNEFTDDNLVLATHTPVTTNTYRSVRYQYTPAGLKAATTTAKCASTTTTTCKPGGTWTPAGTMRVTYGANGRVLDQSGHDSTDARAITTSYTQDGHVKTVRDPISDMTTTLGYYLDGKVRTVAESGGGLIATNSANTNEYAYDASGQLTVRTDETAAGGSTNGSKITTSTAYSKAGMPTAQKSGVLGSTTSYTFDKAGRPSTAVTGTHTNEWTWYANNALASSTAKDSGSGSTKVIGKWEYLYDGNRNITRQTTSSDTGGVMGAVADYQYAQGEQLTQMDWNPDTGNTIRTKYTYDANSNRLSAAVQEANPVDSNTPSQITTWGYRLDNSIATQDGPADDTSQATDDDYTFQYDDRGLLINDGCSTKTYDPFDRTTSVAVNNIALCGGDNHTTTFVYDGLDRQRFATVENADEGNVTTRSIYDGASTTVVGQINAVNGKHNNPTVLYQLDPSGRPMAYSQTVADTGKAFLEADGQGNITALTTGNGGGGNGTLACAVAYDPYGLPLRPEPEGTGGGSADANGLCQQTGSGARLSTGNAAWYRGHSRDGSTGTYQLGTRTYDPSKGAFTTPDAYRVASPSTDLSVGVDPLTSNTYTYVNGNPLNGWDPNGHRAIDGNGNELSPCLSNPSSCTPKAAAEAKVAYSKLRRRQAEAQADAEQAEQERLSKMRIYEVTDFDPDHEEGQGKFCLLAAEVNSCSTMEMSTCQTDSHVMCISSGATVPSGGLTLGQGFKLLVFDPSACKEGAFQCLLEVAMAAPSPAKFARLAKLADSAHDLEKLQDATKSIDHLRTGARSCLRSFAGKTPVLMADGSTKPIEDLIVGDEVVATDPETGERVTRKVTKVWVHHDQLLDLFVEGEVVATTEDHLFWSVTDRKFERADALATGEIVVGDHGRTIAVSGFRRGSRRTELAYNLSIAGVHTYHVGTNEILVHNDCYETFTESAGDLSKYTPSQSTRDPASAWYHENLTNDELLDAINHAEAGEGIVVTEAGRILGGHHRYDELMARISDGRIDPNTQIDIQKYTGE